MLDKDQSNYICNLIVPGFPKCGTSSLHEYLNLHSEIEMSSRKEPHFFERKERVDKGPIQHNSLFNQGKSVQYFGESTTTYCIDQNAIQNIKQLLIEPKIIIIMRHPVERLVSHYKWLCALGLENKTMADAIVADGYGFNPYESFSGNYKAYLQFSNYSKIVPEWQKTFGSESILLVSTESLSNNHQYVLSLVWDFLGLNQLNVDRRIESNATRDVQRKKLPLWLAKTNRMIPKSIKSGLRARLNPIKEQLRDKYGREQSISPVISESDIQQLNVMLASDIEFFKVGKENGLIK